MPLEGQIDQYRIERKLGSGAMGEVYLATDTRMFGRKVAIKILSESLSENEHARGRFEQEVETAAGLEHPNIVTIHDQGEFDGRPFFVMEYLDGSDLTHWITHLQDRDLAWRLDVGRQICLALSCAHEHDRRVIHRDIKPANIMVVSRGGNDVVKLLDFGIVHVEHSGMTTAHTQPGTFAYMSPEQLRGDPVDARSDLFSFGLVLYELLTGVHPFQARNDLMISNRILDSEPDPPRSHSDRIPRSVESLVLQLLEKDSGRRPPSARVVAESLKELRLALERGHSTDPDTGIDELTRRMLDDLVGWSRQKESEGRFDEALVALEKARKLAPDSKRIAQAIQRLRHREEQERSLERALRQARRHLEEDDFERARDSWRHAWVLRPDSERVAELDRRIAVREERARPDAGADGGVAGRLEAARDALERGDSVEARKPLVEILRSDPNNAPAQKLLNDVLEITSRGIPYGKYRGLIRDARRFLAQGAFTEALDALRQAAGIWPDDEVGLLEREIQARRTECTDERRGEIAELQHGIDEAGGPRAPGPEDAPAPDPGASRRNVAAKPSISERRRDRRRLMAIAAATAAAIVVIAASVPVLLDAMRSGVEPEPLPARSPAAEQGREATETQANNDEASPEQPALTENEPPGPSQPIDEPPDETAGVSLVGALEHLKEARTLLDQSPPDRAAAWDAAIEGLRRLDEAAASGGTSQSARIYREQLESTLDGIRRNGRRAVETAATRTSELDAAQASGNVARMSRTLTAADASARDLGSYLGTGFEPEGGAEAHLRLTERTEALRGALDSRRQAALDRARRALADDVEAIAFMDAQALACFIAEAETAEVGLNAYTDEAASTNSKRLAPQLDAARERFRSLAESAIGTTRSFLKANEIEPSGAADRFENTKRGLLRIADVSPATCDDATESFPEDVSRWIAEAQLLAARFDPRHLVRVLSREITAVVEDWNAAWSALDATALSALYPTGELGRIVGSGGLWNSIDEDEPWIFEARCEQPDFEVGKPTGSVHCEVDYQFVVRGSGTTERSAMVWEFEVQEIEPGQWQIVEWRQQERG